jgi:hypothetical protein
MYFAKKGLLINEVKDARIPTRRIAKCRRNNNYSVAIGHLSIARLGRR